MDTFDTKGIKYKFKESDYIDKNKVIDEGPLIYNTKKLNKNMIYKIENIDINELYYEKDFGHILGYECPLDISKRKKNRISINYWHEVLTKFPTGPSRSVQNHLYGFFCYKLNLKNVYDKAIKFNKFVKKIDKNYSIHLHIELE